MDAAARREAHKHWKGQIFRSWDEAARFDARFWNDIPVEERVSNERELGPLHVRRAPSGYAWGAQPSRGRSRLRRGGGATIFSSVVFSFSPAAEEL
ncbi:MAG: hypothetical protein NVSMB1_00450 [Polyangiales bacterium]